MISNKQPLTMKICNDSFNTETPELASIFARWPFPLSDFQKKGISF